jgi:ribose 5-phosphate isomerase B
MGEGMKVAIGCDHAGLPLKQELMRQLAGLRLAGEGVAFIDMGTDSTASVDYPDFASAVARAVAGGTAERGILICGTGIGMAIAANKVGGVRCAPCFDCFTARMAREHNDANVLALGARVTGPGLALEIARTWLVTPFGGGRHALRVEKIAALERDTERGGGR